jgi:hypothetical protein
MEDRAGVEAVEAWLSTLAPRAELVARMALHLRFHELRGDKRYFTRIAALIQELQLKAEDLGAVRADAQEVAAFLDHVEPRVPATSEQENRAPAKNDSADTAAR